MNAHLTITADGSAFLPVIAEARALLSELDVDLVRKIVDNLGGVAELRDKIGGINIDPATATTADRVVVRLKPSDGLLEFVTALRAAKADFGIVEAEGHSDFPSVDSHSSTVGARGAGVIPGPAAAGEDA